MSALNTSQGVLFNVQAKNSNTKSFKAEHECSQLNCGAFDTTSTETDIEESVRTKATRFLKAYPKAPTWRTQTSSSEANWTDRSDKGETKSKNHSTELVRSQNAVISPNIYKRYTSANKKVINRSVSIPNVNLSSNSDENESNNNSSQYRLVQNQCYKSLNVVPYNKTAGESLKYLESMSTTYSTSSAQTGRSYSNCIEILSTSSSDKSSSETENSAEDHSTKKRNASVPSTSYNASKATTLINGRPFKSYPENPLAVTIGFDTAKMAISRGKPENYNDFRRRMIGKRMTNLSDVNSNMRRFFASETSDSLYKEKRKKNNMAAKRSRDARRVKEDELAIRCAYLEQENMFLKKKLSEMEQEKVKWEISRKIPSK